MKTHIFIATTQGLVAIQNITPIDDEDISSVVSVNGTSTTANISNSYHNFVKKGVGIIHQMFGACSYRVDISARIDQGNSWQVAMYLAHLAQSAGILGYGDVSQGDTVICATGEVNTSSHQILAVAEVALKYKLAQPQLEQWSTLGAKVQFLVPQANQSDIKQNNFIRLVSSLEQAASALPSSSQNQTSASEKHKKLVSTNFQHKLTIAAILLTIIVFLGILKFTAPDNNSHQPVAIKTDSPKAESAQKIQLVAILKQGKTCAQTSSQDVVLKNKAFENLILNQLCELYLQPNGSIVQVLLVAQDAFTVLPLTQSPQGWQIPLPKNRLSDRSYFLVTLGQTLSEEKIEQLRLYRETMPKAEMLTGSALTDWLHKQQLEFVIYSHKLMVK